jgi:hypothetical protein
MSGSPSNAVFVSFRREVGGILALALHQNLTARGLDDFYDIESIRAGQFDTIVPGGKHEKKVRAGRDLVEDDASSKSAIALSRSPLAVRARPRLLNASGSSGLRRSASS